MPMTRIALMADSIFAARSTRIYGAKAFNNATFLSCGPPPKCEVPEKKGISSLFQNLQGDDLLILGLMILLLNEGGEDNYIMLIILAALLFN